ncbi:hypothetical protein TSA6c_00020 [Azospirillum sp. TSA6c]|uniref:hypothetical protein n=1 Tax=Azospirillum sp. TSA6c TaxID=709813 RepID=UPI000D616845|nr:hypothetical protein [Azospirillum sp. TSA6c]PWC54667.1 hypothetical protein TSA6c_00020 [Azospirillum sp. TSA6c]
MTRSMAPTIAAVERITPPAGPSVSRLAYSYSRGYEDGLQHGAQSAYRRMTYALVPLAVVGGIVAWMIG